MSDEVAALDRLAARGADLAPRWGGDRGRELEHLRRSARELLRAGDRTGARALLARCSALLDDAWSASILDCYASRPARRSTRW